MIIKLEKRKALSKNIKGIALLQYSGKTNTTWSSALTTSLNKKIRKGNFKASRGEVFIQPQIGKKPEWVFFIGLGEKDKVSVDVLAKGIARAIRLAGEKDIQHIAFSIPEDVQKKYSEEKVGVIIATAATTATYDFVQFKKENKTKKVGNLTICISKEWDEKKLKVGIHEGVVIGNAINTIRDYGNAPANHITPKALASLAGEIAKKNKQKITILSEKHMEKEKMGGTLGVSKGSSEEAQFIIIEHMKGGKGEKPIVLVGKGITFDSGGISIKPSSEMDEMRYDMSGGGAVLGVMKAIGELNLRINVVALVPATENVPSGTSYKPGDILTYADGTTVEVMNTDAEGRLILADGLIYARKYKPKAIIDIATLTGAIIVALGDSATGLFVNNKELKEKILRASENVGESMWHMPLPEEYKERVVSTFADLRNTSNTPGAGSVTAAKFLEAFIKNNTPWVHLDIAGTAWKMSKTPYSGAGATGAGVKTLVEYLKQEQKND